MKCEQEWTKQKVLKEGNWLDHRRDIFVFDRSNALPWSTHFWIYQRRMYSRGLSLLALNPQSNIFLRLLASRWYGIGSRNNSNSNSSSSEIVWMQSNYFLLLLLVPWNRVGDRGLFSRAQIVSSYYSNIYKIQPWLYFSTIGRTKKLIPTRAEWWIS